jgi:hypothetical protein
MSVLSGAARVLYVECPERKRNPKQVDPLRVEGTRQMTITSFEPRPVVFHFSADAFQLLLMVLTGWLARREREVVDYLDPLNT